MECKDIRKLLSPFVDNELGAQDTFTVAEHLEDCAPCQREMEALRRFDQHLRAAGHAPLEGIDEVRAHILALVSPWAWARPWRGVGAAAAVLLFLVIGRQLFSAPADPEATAFGEALITEMQLNATQPFSLAWLDPRSVQDVLHQEGLEDLPNLGPVGFHLEGARVCYPLGRVFVQLVYRSRNEEVSLFVSKRWNRPLAGMSKQDGFTIVPLGLRAVFLVSRGPLENFPDVRQLAEEEVNALST